MGRPGREVVLLHRGRVWCADGATWFTMKGEVMKLKNG